MNRLAALLLGLFRILPPGFAWWLGGLLGHAFGSLPLRDQRRAREHLRRAFPAAAPAWIERTARNAFRHTGRMALWTLATAHWEPARLRRGIRLEGVEHMRESARASRRGEGVFLFTGHFGNWELLARTYAALSPTTVIARRLRSPLADALVGALRVAGGARVFYQDGDSRELIRRLRAGEAVATLADQDIPALDGCFVPWFGEPAYTPSGPAALAILARVAVQSVFCYRKGGRWVVQVSPRWKPERGADRAEAIRACTARATAWQEALVRRHPEQWVWWHKRWRTRPEDLACRR